MADTLVNHKLDRVRNDLQHPKSPQTLGSYAPASNTTTDTLSIHVPELGDDDHEPPKISNFEFVASYNWLDESTPTILVPGTPPIWSPPAVTPALEPDSGLCYVDQNADRNPVSPMATLIRAVETSKPQFDFGSIDVITDRRPIRKLYGFVDGETHEFRFGVTILGDTAFFTRMEPRTRDECRITEYRRAFETSYTKLPGYAKGSTSHHRIVGYNFGGLSFLVRSAVDAYYVQALKPELSKQIQIDRLIDFVKAVSLEEPKPSFTMKRTALGNVVKGGQEIPHEATLELTTRRSNPARWKLDPKVLDNKIADLWISQTANFVEAYHCPVKNMKHLPWRRQYASTRSAVSSATGCQPPKVQFTDIRVKPMAEKLVDWEAQNAKNVEKLSLVLKEVIGAAKGFKGSCIVSFDGTPGGSLKVCQAEEGQVPDLPDQLQALFLPDTRKE